MTQVKDAGKNKNIELYEKYNSSSCFTGAALQAQASETLDQAKEKASGLVAAAQEKGRTSI